MVIAIIAILAALLLPALVRAKQSAYRAVDLNNLKQFGVALSLVAGDNQDTLPWDNWLSGDIILHTQGWLYALGTNEVGGSQYQVQTGSFWPVLGNGKVYLCPSDNTNAAWFRERGQQITSYVMNGAVGGYDRDIYPCQKLAAFNPAGVVFWECANNTELENQTLFNDGASSPAENTSVRHGTVALYAAFDGSSRTMSLTVWSNKMIEPNMNELWCYPGSPDGR